MSTPEQRAKWRAAKKVNRKTGPSAVRHQKRRGSPQVEAMIYLRHARTAIKQQVVSGQNNFDDPVYLFSMLALRALENVEQPKETTDE